VTGAGSGIGRALAQEAARRGYGLALIDLDIGGLSRTAEAVRGLGVPVMQRAVDVRDRQALGRLTEELAERTSDLALVFANAGVLRGGPLWTMAADDIDLVIDVNLKGVVNTLATVVPRLLAQAKPSRIVVTASVGALTAAPELGLYSASKHALWALCESLLRDLRAAQAPVEVSLLCPGAVTTGLADHDGQVAQGMRARMREVGLTPAELARRTFAGIDEGRFWIFPQPDYLTPIRRRLQRVIDGQDPVAPRGP
jgi:NADP-dependent 3-hydroxy acid dehydrogenase YdfG